MVITSRIGGDRFVGVWVSNRRDPGADPVRRCDARGSGYAADDIHGRCIQCAGATHGERCRTAGVVEQATLGQIDGGRSLYGDGAARAAIKAEHAAQTRRIGNRNRRAETMSGAEVNVDEKIRVWGWLTITSTAPEVVMWVPDFGG